MRTADVIFLWSLWFAFLADAVGALLILADGDAGPNFYRRGNKE